MSAIVKHWKLEKIRLLTIVMAEGASDENSSIKSYQDRQNSKRAKANNNSMVGIATRFWVDEVRFNSRRRLYKRERR